MLESVCRTFRNIVHAHIFVEVRGKKLRFKEAQLQLYVLGALGLHDSQSDRVKRVIALAAVKAGLWITKQPNMM